MLFLHLNLLQVCATCRNLSIFTILFFLSYFDDKFVLVDCFYLQTFFVLKIIFLCILKVLE